MFIKIDYNGLKMDFVASKNTNNLKPFLIYYNHSVVFKIYYNHSVVFKELQCGKTKLRLVKKNQLTTKQKTIYATLGKK